MMPASFFLLSNGTIATEHTTDIAKDTTSLPGGRATAQLHIHNVCTILFHLHHTNLVLTDDDDDDDYDNNNEEYVACYYYLFYIYYYHFELLGH